MKNIILNNYLLLIILGIAAILRLVHLGSIPISLNLDETAIGYNAYSIFKTGLDEYGKVPIALRSFGDWKLPIYPLFSILPIFVFDLNEFSVRLVSSIAGIYQVFIIYFIALKIFNKKSVGLFSSFFLALSPWSIYFSRIAYEVNLANAFFLTGFWFLLEFLENHNRSEKKLLLASFFFGLTVFTYHAYIIFTPLFIFFVFIYMRKYLGKNFWTLVSVITISIFCFSSIFLASNLNKSKLSDVTVFNDKEIIYNRVDIFRNDSASSNILLTRLLHNKFSATGYHISQNYLNSFSPNFLFDKGGEKFLHNIGTFGNLYLFDVLLLFFGFVGIIKFGNNKKIPLLLIWLMLSPIPSALTKDSPSSTRLFIMLPALILIIALGADYLFEKLKNYSLIGKLGIVFLSLLFILNVIYFMDAYFIHMNNQRARYLHYGFKEVVEVSQKYKNYDVVMFGPENFPYISFLFYTKYDPNKFRSEVQYYPENYANFVFVKKFGKYEFVDNIDYENLKENTIYFDYRGIRDEDYKIKYPSGEPAVKYFFKEN